MKEIWGVRMRAQGYARFASTPVSSSVFLRTVFLAKEHRCFEVSFAVS